MIRLFTVFCKLNQLSFSDRTWLEREKQSLNPVDQACPFCGAVGCLTPFAQYTRYLVSLEGGRPVTHTIRIQRLRCTSCRHTHAVLPSTLVPFRCYSLRVILTILQHYFLHRMTVEQICERYGISRSTLYNWKALFVRHKALWLGVLQDMACKPSTFLQALTGKRLSRFFHTFQFSLLQGKRTCDRSLPSPGG